MGAVVADVRRWAVDSEVGILIVVDRRDDVPSCPTFGQVVERRPHACGIERVVLAHRESGGDSDMPSRRSHPGKERDRVVFRRLGRVAKRGIHRALVGVGDVVEVRKEDHVEHAPFTDLGDMLVKRRSTPVEAGRSGLGVPPHGQTVIGRSVHQELGQVHLLFCTASHCTHGCDAGCCRANHSCMAFSIVMKIAPPSIRRWIRRSSIIMRWPRPMTCGWKV